MFDEDSQLVKTWVRLVGDGVYTREQIPNLSNLRDVVGKILDRAKIRRRDDYGIYEGQCIG